jgi:hypothetical protein
MNEYLEIMQRKLGELNDQSLTVESLLDKIATGTPIRMSEELVNRLLHLQPLEGTSHLKCSFEGEHLVLTGNTKVMLVPVPFRLELKPILANGRRMQFEVVDLKPTLKESMKRKLLKDADGVTYEDNKLTINFNELEVVRDIPFGKLAGIRIKDQTLWCKIVM